MSISGLSRVARQIPRLSQTVISRGKSIPTGDSLLNTVRTESFMSGAEGGGPKVPEPVKPFEQGSGEWRSKSDGGFSPTAAAGLALAAVGLFWGTSGFLYNVTDKKIDGSSLELHTHF